MSNSTELPTTATEDFIIGSIYLVTCTTMIIFYIPCLKVMRTDPEFAPHPCYKMMFHLGIADLILCSCQGWAGFLSMTRLAYNVPFWLNRIFGGLVDGLTWYMSTALLHVLAFNRWSAITGCDYANTFVFTEKGTNIILGVLWTYSFIWCAALLSPWGGFLYYADIWTFYFDMKAPWFAILKALDWWHNQLMLWPSGVWYIWTVLKIRSQRKEAVEGTESHQRMLDREQTMAKQAAIIFFYTMMGSQYFHAAPYLYGDLKFRYAYVVGNWLWLTNAGINPLVYLTMNKSLKKKVFKLVGKKTETTKVQPARSVKKPAAKEAVIVENME